MCVPSRRAACEPHLQRCRCVWVRCATCTVLRRAHSAFHFVDAVAQTVSPAMEELRSATFRAAAPHVAQALLQRVVMAQLTALASMRAVPRSQLRDAVELLSPEEWVDLCAERNCCNLCGYALCDNDPAARPNTITYVRCRTPDPPRACQAPALRDVGTAVAIGDCAHSCAPAHASIALRASMFFVACRCLVLVQGIHGCARTADEWRVGCAGGVLFHPLPQGVCVLSFTCTRAHPVEMHACVCERMRAPACVFHGVRTVAGIPVPVAPNCHALAAICAAADGCVASYSFPG